MDDAESLLRYPTSFIGEKREVFLEGEAFFEVAKDAKHPFIVHTNRHSVEVLGTSFIYLLILIIRYIQLLQKGVLK